MKRAYLPFFFQPTFVVVDRLGADLPGAAILALKAILRNRKSLEVAHQQIEFRGEHYAFSSRVSQSGELILELDVGDPRLSNRLILEEEIREAGRRIRGTAPEHRPRR